MNDLKNTPDHNSYCGELVYSMLASDPIVFNLLPKYTTHLEKKIARMETLIRPLSPNELSDLCHELKGSLSQYGYPNESRIAEDMERVIASIQNGGATPAQLNEINSLFEILKSKQKLMARATEVAKQV